jgi:CheY-like chemotaxis protein
LPLDKGDYIEISIKDEGVGISKEDLLKVFDPYYSTKSSAAGLGLSTAETIIKNHNGHIKIDSSFGVGTTVYLYMPVFHDKEAELKLEPDKTVEYDDQLLSGKRVLVMDDEEFIRKVAGNILAHLGCIVDFAKEGNEAIEKYKTSLNTDSSFDFVILDLTVTDGLGGEETLKQLIKIDPDVKAFVSSGYSHDPVMVNYKDYGFAGVINKPYEIEDFIKSFCDLAEKGST